MSTGMYPHHQIQVSVGPRNAGHSEKVNRTPKELVLSLECVYIYGTKTTQVMKAQQITKDSKMPMAPPVIILSVPKHALTVS